MDVILIPGLWLDAASWDAVLPPIAAAGHRPIPLRPPGLGAPSDSAAEVGLADWIGSVTAAIDAADGPVVLVGHSGGGNAAWGAADARPDRVARVVFVDTVPPPDGAPINEFEAVDGVVPFPGWDFFDDEEVHDLDSAVRARTAALTGAVPERIPHDPITLGDERRHGIPVTLLMGGLDAAGVESVLAQWPAHAAEYRAIADHEVVRIGSGHWPQFSIPERLGELIVAAIR
ncbi:alpha/beta fold hydrolase [Tsukamurella ocularis]|uniref:alpha/beta fold hydrolase n=1 Tax=Tsukamurella ocularis TaxID=1970234 RepID=UPI0039EE9217